MQVRILPTMSSHIELHYDEVKLSGGHHKADAS